VIFYDYYQHNILPLVDLKRPLNAIPLCPTRTVLQQMQQQHGYKHINWHAFGISCRQHLYELQAYVVTDIIQQWLFIVILTYFTSLDFVLTWPVYWTLSNSVQVLTGSVSQQSGKEDILAFIADLSGIAACRNRVLIYKSLILNDQFSIQQYHLSDFLVL